MKMVLVESPRDKAKYYGGPMMPSVSGVLWECESREEYLELVEAYEESEANCNTCMRLVRHQHSKRIDGMLPVQCGKDGSEMLIHPHDPMHMPCWESRREAKRRGGL